MCRVFYVAVGNIKGMGEDFRYWLLNLSSVTGIQLYCVGCLLLRLVT
jgi:hypothetical protein